jgi:hypothetical protein
VGATQAAPAADPDPRLAGFRDTPGGGGQPGAASETLREIPPDARRAAAPERPSVIRRSKRPPEQSQEVQIRLRARFRSSRISAPA